MGVWATTVLDPIAYGDGCPGCIESLNETLEGALIAWAEDYGYLAVADPPGAWNVAWIVEEQIWELTTRTDAIGPDRRIGPMAVGPAICSQCALEKAKQAPDSVPAEVRAAAERLLHEADIRVEATEYVWDLDSSLPRFEDDIKTVAQYILSRPRAARDA